MNSCHCLYIYTEGIFLCRWLDQFSSRGYLCAQKSPLALHAVSLTLPLKYSSNARLIDDGCLSHPVNKGRLALPLSAPGAIDGVMYSVLYLQVVSGAPPHFRSSEKQATCEGCFARQCICSIQLHNYLLLQRHATIHRSHVSTRQVPAV